MKKYSVELGTGNPAGNPNGEVSRWVEVESHDELGARVLAQEQCDVDEYIGTIKEVAVDN